jgi:CubicO group peptidase (beta-lactamase class C family)
MMHYWRWSARSIIVALLLAVSLACGAQPSGGPATSVQPTAVASSSVPHAELGTAIDGYIAHGSVNLQNIRAVLVSQRGELLAERYYHSDAAEHVEIQSATKSVISTLVGIGHPGTFVYSDIGPHLLSAVLGQATGMSTLAYARRELFDPLGIDSRPAFEGPIADVD